MSKNLERVRRSIAAWCRKEREEGKPGVLPHPFPSDFDAAVIFWAVKMQEPRRDAEHADDHATRCLQSLAMFLSMNDADRSFVIGGVEDGVPYRGDRPEMYRNIYEQTMEMRQDKEAYIANATANMRKFLRR